MPRAGSQRSEPAASIGRRLFLLGLGAAMWPRAGQAQPTRRRIGMLLARRPEDSEVQAFVEAFRQGLIQLGWRQNQDYELLHRWLPRDVAEARKLAEELIAEGAEILVVLATPYLRGARAATSDLPIVFVALADPVGQGFVSGLARPVRNITGFAAEEPTLGGKWLGLLKEVAPALRHCTVVFNPESAPAVPQFLESVKSTGTALSVEAAAAPIRNYDDIDGAIASAAKAPNGGLIFLPDAFTLARREQIVAQVERHRLPAVYYHRAYVQAGGLLSYGIDRPQQFRYAARYVHLILTGTSPADLPVQLPTDFEMAVNLRAAKALGMEIPTSLLARADEVIE